MPNIVLLIQGDYILQSGVFNVFKRSLTEIQNRLMGLHAFFNATVHLT